MPELPSALVELILHHYFVVRERSSHWWLRSRELQLISRSWRDAVNDWSIAFLAQLPFCRTIAIKPTPRAVDYVLAIAEAVMADEPCARLMKTILDLAPRHPRAEPLRAMYEAACERERLELERSKQQWCEVLELVGLGRSFASAISQVMPPVVNGG